MANLTVVFQRVGEDLPKPLDWPAAALRRALDALGRRPGMGRTVVWPTHPPAAGRPRGKGLEFIAHSGDPRCPDCRRLSDPPRGRTR